MAIASSNQTPLPFAQIAVLMGVRLAEPISYTVIFPFINQMIEELGVTDNPDKVGFYSGLVESVFAFVQFFTVYHWAKLSDRIGRKPVILIGLIGVAISGALFGLSTNFWMMIAIRSISGALNGNVAVVKAAIGDVTDETNSTEAFAMYGLTWTVGSIIGNAMGGTLSHPCEVYPEIFGNVQVFRKFPYLLPCLVSTLFTFIGIIFAAIYYKESASIPQSRSRPISMRPLLPGGPSSSILKHRGSGSISSNLSDTDTLVGSPIVEDGKSPTSGWMKGSKSMEAMDRISEEGGSDQEYSPTLRRQYDRDELDDLGEDDEDGEGFDGAKDSGENWKHDTERLISKAPQGMDAHGFGGSERKGWGFWELMRYRPVQILCMTMFLTAFVGGAWSAVSLLFFFDRKGGLSMSAHAIGTALALNGLWTMAVQLLLLNRIRRWLGIGRAYKTLSFGWVAVFILLPLLRNLLEATEVPTPSDDPYEPIRYGPTRGWPVSIGVNLILSFVTVVAMSNSLLMVLINFASPDKTALGAVNGIATAVSCMARVLGPSSVSALFAVSMDGQVLGGRLWWIFMAFMAFCSFTVTLLISHDGKPPPLKVDPEHGEEQDPQA